MRPESLENIIGQNKTKEIINILLESAKQRNTAIPHQLFGGNPGTGKTTFALAIGYELESNVILANGGNISNFKDIKKYINNIRHKDILFIDEIHRLNTSTCETLYHIMEDFRYTTTDRLHSHQVELPRFTLIGATTQPGKLPKPLRDRFKFIHNFAPYTLEELCQIVKLVFKQNKINLKDTEEFNISKIIARTCRGNPRHVINRAEWIRDYILTQGREKEKTKDGFSKSINKEGLLKAIELAGFDENGFTSTDRAYIDVLLDGCEISLRNLVSTLGIDQYTIENEIEPFLIRLGLVSVGSKGRYINRQVARKYGFKMTFDL